MATSVCHSLLSPRKSSPLAGTRPYLHQHFAFLSFLPTACSLMAKAKHLSINSKLGLLTPRSRSRYLKSERGFGHEELPRPCNVHRDSVDIENYSL